MKIKEILEDVNDPNLEVNKRAAQRALDFTKEQREAAARAKFHREQAQRYKGKDDPESKAAYEAHKLAEMDFGEAAQDYMHKSPKVAANRIRKAEENIAKSKLAQKDVDANY